MPRFRGPRSNNNNQNSKNFNNNNRFNKNFNNNHQCSYPPQGRRHVRGRGGSQYSSRSHGDDRNQRQRFDRGEEFFLVTIVQGQRYSKDELYSLLHENLDDMDDPTVFYNYKQEPQAITFYVRGKDKAETLRALSRRIRFSSGHPVTIFTTPSSTPYMSLKNDELRDLFVKVIPTRYDQQTQILNLSKFGDCDSFRMAGVYVTMTNRNILKILTESIVQTVPDVIGINLSDNRIIYLESFKNLNQCQRLKALDLSNNKIRGIEELRHLEDLDLLELVLEGNPFVDNYPTQATYISAVRNIFKNLKKVDKEDLPDQIGFDLGVQDNLPSTIDSYIPNDALRNVVTGFLQEYYRLYDTDNREQLMMAYHDSAVFSLSLAQSQHMYKPSEIAFQEQHNLLRGCPTSEQVRRVKVTRTAVVELLNKLPITRHHLESFKVDTPLFSEEFIQIIVNGVFEETCKHNSPLRAFCRTFFLIPNNGGWAIINDMFLIAPASMKQHGQYKPNQKKFDSKKGSSVGGQMMENDMEFDSMPKNDLYTASAVAGVSSASSIASTSMVDQREQIISKFREVTKMNRGFSLKCLEENGFNPDAAYAVFQTLKDANAIPPEAFH